MKLRYLFFLLFLVQFCNGQKATLNVSIDDRIETLYSVAYLNNYFLIGNHANIYKNTIDERLISLKDHRVVSLFDSISKKYNFSYYRPVEWILQYSDFPEFKKIKSKADLHDLTIAEGKEDLLEEFRLELIKFNQESVFQNYLKDIKPVNALVIKKVLESKTIKKLPDYLEDYYGTKLHSYNLILSPLLHSGGFNSEIKNKNRETEVYAIVGANGEIDFYPHFDKNYLDTDMILHEFGHSFVNPLMEKYAKEIEALKHKYYTEALQKNGKEQGDSEWKYVFNELLLRAIVINITKNKFGPESADQLLKFEKSIGFNLVVDIANKLKKYENNRAVYKKFSDYYPELLRQMR